MLVAAHAWDIAGAQAQGLQTAFIQRPGKYPYPNASEAEITCPDLKALASKLIQYN